MQSNFKSATRPSRITSIPASAWLHYLLVILTLGAGAATLFEPVESTGVFDALLLLLATAAAISVLSRLLPLQSVLFAAFITALFGTVAAGLSGKTGIPMGPVVFGRALGPKLFHVVPATIGLFWIIAIFTSRGVARLVLRPWRKAGNYGFVLIGLTAALAAVFDFALEPVAHLKQFWFWQPTKIHLTWYHATPVTFMGWIFVTLIVMVVITPFLIRKQPGTPVETDVTPLILWLGALGLFAGISARAGFWPAVIVDAAAAVIVVVFSWRGARR